MNTNMYYAIGFAVVLFKIIMETIANSSNCLDTTRSISGSITVNLMTVYVATLAFSFIVYDITQP